MTLLYGFMGAHRTGKTTVARQLAADIGVPFCETNLSQALSTMSIDPQADIGFKRRLEIQNTLLDLLLAGYAKARAENPGYDAIIVDRTPLDILAYTMSEVLRETLGTPEINDAYAAHEARCFQASNFNFAGICLVQPGIALVADASKAPANAHYQRHIHAAMMDVAYNERNRVDTLILPRKCLKVTSRVNESFDHLDTIISRQDETRTVANAYSGAMN